MKHHILTWLWQQLQPPIEQAIRIEAERLIAELRAELERQATEAQAAARPSKRFIGQ
jgi:vacuolar-type H+-ATPase subunit E/Vma4